MDIKFNDNNDIFSLDEAENILNKPKVTISVQKRNGRKYVTTVTGISEDLDLKKILSYIKKTYSCNGSILNDDNYGEIIMLTGDQKDNIYNFLINEEINNKEDIIIKGI
jgi:translation initiation factor 1